VTIDNGVIKVTSGANHSHSYNTAWDNSVTDLANKAIADWVDTAPDSLDTL
jgi:hypothetical protein